MIEIGPLTDMNRRRAQIRELASIDSRTSTCMALLARHVMSKHHRFEFAAPPRVLLVTIVQCPNTSTPTFVNGANCKVQSI